MAETETGRPCIHPSHWQHSTPAMSQSCPAFPEALCPSLFFSVSFSITLHVPSFALNWWDSQDNRLWRLQQPLAHIQDTCVGCESCFGSGIGTCSDGNWHMNFVSAVNAELDLAVLCFVICFYEDILFFKFSLSVNSYIFRSPDVCQTHHRSIVSICTKSVTRKWIAWSGFHIIKSVPKSHSHRHQKF